jgi:hypothetical protein
MCTEFLAEPAACMMSTRNIISGKSVRIYQTARRHIATGNYIHGYRRTNQTCHKGTLVANLTHIAGQWAQGFYTG